MFRYVFLRVRGYVGAVQFATVGCYTSLLCVLFFPGRRGWALGLDLGAGALRGRAAQP